MQLKALSPAEPGHRKIILATNIAETSITIPGVKYVIDTGMVKLKGWNVFKFTLELLRCVLCFDMKIFGVFLVGCSWNEILQYSSLSSDC